MIRISKLAESVKPSATLAAGAKAKQMKAAGIRVYDFSLGEPDFNTPAHICAAADEAMKKGFTHYTPVGGVLEVRQAIVRWYKRMYGYEFTADMVLVSNGAKHSIHNALAATVGPGDEVLIPTPYWVSYSDLVSMTGATAVLIETTADTHFKLTPNQLQAAITPKTRLIMLNSPSNPTGSVYSREELTALVDVILKKDLIILSDEIYEQLTYDGAEATCIATLKPELKERTITISGASKSYAMTGWRMGWTIAPKPVIDAMNNIQSQETSCPSSVSQYALIAALDGPQECVAEMRVEFDKRRNLVCQLLASIPGIKFFKPNGAFYLFFDVSAHFGRTFKEIVIRDSMDFCKAALEQAHVNLVPGIAFGCEGYARMSYATSETEIREGLMRLREWLAT
jgi:aspartate aminotransferase